MANPAESTEKPNIRPSAEGKDSNMEATTKNLENIKTSLTFDLVLIRGKYMSVLDEEQMKLLEAEFDRKIMRMLPGYSGNLPPTKAFANTLWRTAASFVAKLK